MKAACEALREDDTQVPVGVVVGAENAVVLVVAAVRLGQFIAPIRHEGRVVRFRRFTHHIGEVVEEPHQFHFIGSRCSQAFGGHGEPFGFRLAQHAASPHVVEENEGAGVAVEVDGRLRVEHHVLLGVYLEEEVLEGTQSHALEHLLLLGVTQSVEFAGFRCDVAGDAEHVFHEVVRIDDGAFSALHFAFRQLDHAVAEVVAA